LTPTATITATETIRPAWRTFHIGGVNPQIRPVAFDRPRQEGRDPLVDLLAQARDLAFGDAAHPHGLDQIVDRAGRDALHIGFLDDGGERLLGHPAGLQEARKVGALAELRDAQLDGPGPGLPVALAIAIALGQPERALLAVTRPGGGPHFQFHQPLGGKADHLAQQIGVGRLFHKGAKVHHGVGHRWFLR
jgi:hypothetical protein